MVEAILVKVTDLPLEWGQFTGLGAVILLLFSALFYLLKTNATERKELVEHSTAERKSLHIRHADERRAWKMEADRRADRLEAVITRLTDAVRDQHNRQYPPPPYPSQYAQAPRVIVSEDQPEPFEESPPAEQPPKPPVKPPTQIHPAH